MLHYGSDEDDRLINGPSGNTYSSVGRNNRISRSEDNEYTELLRGSVPCPTCRGLGNVPKEQEGQLIALIPMKDKRLKPRRTYLWVGLAVVLCLTLAGLLIFFMFPRDVKITSTRPYLKPSGPVLVNVTNQLVKFSVMNRINVANDNYFPLKVTSVKMTILYDTQVISEVTNSSKLEVSIRSNKDHFVAINITLDKENQLGYMATECLSSVRWQHEMVMQFEFTCNYDYFGHSEQITMQTFQFVSCYRKEPPTTIKPSTTTTKPLPPTNKIPA